ncbi:Peroxiredoxin OsmC [Anaerolineae bacterium]|nr:Peroxiredoxin OsmC [Anaerolineae bacterium]
MPIRHAQAIWNGTLREGSGRMKYGAYEGKYTFASRFETGEGTNPEELVGAAHAGCFSMFLSALLTKEGFTPTRIFTTAKVHIEDGPTITMIELDTEANVPDLTDAKLQEIAAAAKAQCPVSKAMASVNIKLNAKLV